MARACRAHEEAWLARHPRHERRGIFGAGSRAACHGCAAAREGDAGRHRLCLHEVLRYGLGHHADPTISGAGRLRRVAAELHERRDHRWHRRLGQDAGLHCQQYHGQPARARPHPPRRRQGRRGAHRVSRRRGAWPDHAARGRNLPPGRLCRQRQGDLQSMGRALVEAGRQRHGQRAIRLHGSDRRRDAAKRADPPLLHPARQRSDPCRASARLPAGGDIASAARDDRASRRGRRGGDARLR